MAHNLNHSIILLSLFVVFYLFAGCALMYQYKPLKKFNQKDYDVFIASVSDEEIEINHIISDYEQFYSYRKINNDSIWQYYSAQQVQILYFKNNSLISYHINCTAKGSIFNVNWNTDNRFDFFPPISAVQITNSMLCASKLMNIYDISNNNDYKIVIFWSNMLTKFSKSAINEVKSNIQTYCNDEQPKIVLINTDKYYISLES